MILTININNINIYLAQYISSDIQNSILQTYADMYSKINPSSKLVKRKIMTLLLKFNPLLKNSVNIADSFVYLLQQYHPFTWVQKSIKETDLAKYTLTGEFIINEAFIKVVNDMAKIYPRLISNFLITSFSRKKWVSSFNKTFVKKYHLSPTQFNIM